MPGVKVLLHMTAMLAQVTGGRDALELKGALMKEGVMVRHYATKELQNYVRISVGRPDQTDTLMVALAKC